MTIDVVPYDPRWAAAFAWEHDRLVEALAPWLAGGVEHVGSTAVPGLAAQPLLDLVAGVASVEEARDALPVLARLGYELGVHGSAEALLLTRSREGRQTHALLLTEVGSALWRERLAFRDALLASPSVAQRYAALKRRLAAEHTDVRSYTSDKRLFVATVLQSKGIVLAP
ncbi:MAG: hypothetical protein JWN08_360 [Frankiales bacterium]|nr:hypothetical protein [Frankiales bacterium]